MGVEAEVLILGPFREVIERGKEAVDNAEDAGDEDVEASASLLKAAQAIVKEGERALKRIQPLWDSQVEKYGDAFKDRLSRNDDIEDKRRRLEDLLYDFEDYIEVTTFEQSHFTELQAATKGLALTALDLIKKLKLDPTKSPAFPPLPPLPSIATGAQPPSFTATASSLQRRPPTPGGHRSGEERTNSPTPSLPTQSIARRRSSAAAAAAELHDGGAAVLHQPRTARRSNYDRVTMNTVRSHRSLASNGTARSLVSVASLDSLPPPAYTAPEESPRSASRTPTPDLAGSPASSVLTPGLENISLSSSKPFETTSAVSYSVFPLPRLGHQQAGNGTRITAWVSDQADSSSSSRPNRPPSRYVEPHSPQSLQNLQSLTIPEDQAVGVVRPKHSSVIDFSPLAPTLSQLGHFNVDSSVTPSPSVSASSPERSRMFQSSRNTSATSFQPISEQPLSLQTPDEVNTGMHHNQILIANSALSPLSLPAAAIDQASLQSHSGPSDEIHTVLSSRASITAYSSASFNSSQAPGPQPREADLTIGPSSSLHQLHGVCTGAQSFRTTAHQDGILRLAGHVAGVSTATARCESCSYGHAFSELALDVTEHSPRATFPRPQGVLFRIRLLYKSHLVASRPSEAFYACLFCAQAGCVPHEGDPTVFRSADGLFRHLARHPQPLPEVPGLTVLYGKEILTTDPRVHDFDLWLTEGPAPPPDSSPNTENLLARLPVATAVKSHVQRYAEKKLPRPEGFKKTNAPLLQFFVGARIIGVEFPRSLAGKWCTGWHDEEWGYFPAKSIELEKPQPGRVDAPPVPLRGMESAVRVSVVARWRWEGSTAGSSGAIHSGMDWLGFEKGERINGVGWPVLVPDGLPGASGKEAWCWSGLNSKGRFGVFPRSHVDEGTLKEEGNGVGGGVGGGRRKKDGARSLFGVRRRASSASNLSGSVDEII